MEGGTGARSPGVGDYYFQLVFLLVLLAKGGVFVCALPGYVLSYAQSVAGGLYGRTNGTGVGSASWLVCSGRVGENLLGFFLRYIKLDIYCQ